MNEKGSIRYMGAILWGVGVKIQIKVIFDDRGKFLSILLSPRSFLY